MAEREEINKIFKMMNEGRPVAFAEKLESPNRGIACILRVLSEKDRPVTAGELSEEIGVSTARTAFLLRKMSSRNLIITGSDPADARRTLVFISESGKEQLKEETEKFEAMLSYVIDRVGLERVKEFINISNEIKIALNESGTDLK